MCALPSHLISRGGSHVCAGVQVRCLAAKLPGSRRCYKECDEANRDLGEPGCKSLKEEGDAAGPICQCHWRA